MDLSTVYMILHDFNDCFIQYYKLVSDNYNSFTVSDSSELSFQKQNMNGAIAAPAPPAPAATASSTDVQRVHVYVCPFCEKLFQSAQDVRKHMELKHN